MEIVILKKTVFTSSAKKQNKTKPKKAELLKTHVYRNSSNDRKLKKPFSNILKLLSCLQKT